MAISQKIYKRHSKNKYSRNIKKIGGMRPIVMSSISAEPRARKEAAEEARAEVERAAAAVAEAAAAEAAAAEAAEATEQEKGIYMFPNIDQLYVCSDLEGANVFKFEGNIPGRPGNMNGIENIEEIETKILVEQSTFNEKKKLVQTEIENNFNTNSNNGIIGDITNDKTALAYTGDLFDNRPNSIALLENMIGMKKNPTFSKRVIIIGGNRDFNKLRLGIELFLVKSRGESIFSDSNTTLQGILDDANIKFRTRSSRDFRYINWENPKQEKVLLDYTGNISVNEVSKKGKFYARVFSMLEKTMGAKYEAYNVELRKILDSIKPKITIPSANEDDFICKFFCILSMIMCFDYSQDESVIRHPIYTSLSQYAGLIYKYFNYMHPMAYFKINGKNGLLSHSGFPDSGITSPLGYNPTITSNEVPLTTILGNLLADKITLLKLYNTCKENNLTVENIPNIVIRYIQIGGGKPFPNIKFTPIIGSDAFTIIKNKPSMYFGGSDMSKKWLKTYSSDDPEGLTRFNFDFIDPTGNKENLHYHIFGHVPQPFFPSVAQSNDNTTHIALDICRADFGGPGTNNYSFTMLKLTGNDSNPDVLFGRTRLGDVKKGNPKLEDHVIYYKEPLGTFIKNEEGNITFMNKTIYVHAAGAEDGFARTVSIQDFVPAPAASGGSNRKRFSRGGFNKKCKHVCGPLCKKCHKHDHHCMLKCHLCEEENCHKRRKTRKHRKPKKSRKPQRKSRKNTRKK